MPVQIQCPSCAQSLRVPETAIGKTVRCPKCQTTFTAADSGSGAPAAPSPTPAANPFDFGGAPPAKPTANPFDLGSSSPKPSASNPFGDSGGSFGPAQPTNPYASPAGIDSLATRELGGLSHQIINFNNVLETTWKLFSDNFGPMIGVGAVLIGLNIGINMLGNVLQFAGQATQEVAVVIIAQLISMVFSFCAQTFIQLGGIVFGLNLIRTRRANIGDLFAGGKHFVGGCLVSLVVTLITMGIVLVCMAPALALFLIQGPQQVQQSPEAVVGAAVIGAIIAMPVLIYLVYRWFFAMVFVVDRQAGVMESLALSTQYTEGNKFTIFLVLLVVGLLGTLVTIVTCCLGVLGYIPFLMLTTVVMYMKATGQMPASNLPNTLPPLQFPPS